MYYNKITYLDKSVNGTEKHDRSVKRSALDRYIYEDIYGESRTVTDLDNISKIKILDSVSEDIFNCLYKVNPEVYHVDDLDVRAKVGHEIFTKIIELPEFENLRSKSVAKLFESASCTKSLKGIIERMINELYLCSSSFKDVMDKLKQLDSIDYDLENEDLDDCERDSLIENKLSIEGMIQSSLDEPTNIITSVGAAISRGADFIQSNMDRVSSNIESFEAFMRGFGNGKNKAERLPVRDKMEIANKLTENSKFRRVCEDLGRMQEMIGKLQRIPCDKGYEYADVGLGHSIPRILSSEKVLLTDSVLEDSFLKKFSSKSLLEFKTKGFDENKGPIIVCLDESGSMQGKREAWSKSFTMACIQLAYKQKRDCCVIPFSYRANTPFEFYYKDFDYESMADCCSLFLGGGTDYESPMVKAIDYIKKNDAFEKADILFITDGEAKPLTIRTMDELEKIKEHDTKVQAVLIGENVKDDTIKTFADSIVRVKKLSKDDIMMEVFDNIIK